MKTRDAFIKQKLEARKHVLSAASKPKPKDMKWMIDKIDREHETRRALSAQNETNPLGDMIDSADSREDSVDSLFDFRETRSQYQKSTFGIDERPFSNRAPHNETNPPPHRLKSQPSKPNTGLHNRSWSPTRRKSPERVSTQHSRSSTRESPQQLASTHHSQLPGRSSPQRASTNHSTLSSKSYNLYSSEFPMESKGVSENTHKYVEFREMNKNDPATVRIPPVRPSTIATILSKDEQRGDKWTELKMAYRNATVDELLRYGDSYFNKESYDAAKTRYATAIYKANQSGFVDESIADAHVRLAAIVSRDEDTKEIIRHFTCAQEIYENLYRDQKAKKEDVSHLGKKIIEVMTSIANCCENANDIDGALLAHKHVINRAERYFPDDVSLNVKVVNSYAYALSFTANDNEKALRMLNYIISQYSEDSIDNEVMQSFVIKGKILLSQCRSTNEHAMKENLAKEAEYCFMKVIKIYKMHPAKFSSDEMASLIVLNRNAREIKNEIENEKNAIVATESTQKEMHDNNAEAADFDTYHTDDDSRCSYRSKEAVQKNKRRNRADSDSICTSEAEASNGINLCYGCQWFFDINDA